MTTKKPGGLTPLAKILLTGSLGVAAVFATKHFVPSLLGGKRATKSSVPPKADLRVAEAPRTTPIAVSSPPTSEKPGCIDKPEIRMLIWAWNAQQGLLYANG